MFPIPLNIYFEFGAFAVSLIFLKGLFHTRFHWLPAFLCFIVSAELAGRFLAREMSQPNAWLYNFVVPIEYLFWTFIFYQHYKWRLNKTIAMFFLISFSAYSLIWLLINGVYNFNPQFLVIGSISMVVMSVLAFVELYNSDENTSFWKQPMFWICTGLLLFNVGEFSYNLISRYAIDYNLDPGYKLFVSINNKLIYVLYSCIIIAILCQTILRKYREE